ncbi:MAG: hypothetical protein QHG99_01035 [Methanomicrobiales archaeon]|nr:hypothetical protein [Methanomicrobiales archaeon]
MRQKVGRREDLMAGDRDCMMGAERGHDGMVDAIRRWQRVRRAMGVEDHVYVDRLVSMLKAHGEDRLDRIEDPLEAVVFALMIELLRELDRRGGCERTQPMK